MQTLEQEHPAHKGPRHRVEQVPRAVTEEVAAPTHLEEGSVHAQGRIDQRGDLVSDDLPAEVEVRVSRGDNDGREALARVEDLGHDPVAVCSGEGSVDDEGLRLSGDQHAGLVQRRRCGIDDGV